MEKVTKLCAWCGKHPARKYKSGGYSKYCSRECSYASMEALARKQAEELTDVRAVNMGNTPSAVASSPAPKAPEADDLPMCAWCGQYAVRRTKTALSKFCSERCAKASHDDASRKANAAMNRKSPVSSNIYFPATTPQQDWRDANFNPLG